MGFIVDNYRVLKYDECPDIKIALQFGWESPGTMDCLDEITAVCWRYKGQWGMVAAKNQSSMPTAEEWNALIDEAFRQARDNDL